MRDPTLMDLRKSGHAKYGCRNPLIASLFNGDGPQDALNFGKILIDPIPAYGARHVDEVIGLALGKQKEQMKLSEGTDSRIPKGDSSSGSGGSVRLHNERLEQCCFWQETQLQFDGLNRLFQLESICVSDPGDENVGAEVLSWDLLSRSENCSRVDDWIPELR